MSAQTFDGDDDDDFDSFMPTDSDVILVLEQNDAFGWKMLQLGEMASVGVTSSDFACNEFRLAEGRRVIHL
jgi:hypothetical protein